MVRFQADADLNQVIVAALLRKNTSVDFRTAALASLRGLSDAEVLALAAREKRVLVTHDAKTMPRREGLRPGVVGKHYSVLRYALRSRLRAHAGRRSELDMRTSSGGLGW